MSEADPRRDQPGYRVTVDDVRQLMGASTPHFALQLRNRIARLIEGLDPQDPARVLGETEIRRLQTLGTHGEVRGTDAQPGMATLQAVDDTVALPEKTAGH